MQTVNVINAVLQQPVLILLLVFGVFLAAMRHMKVDFPTFVVALNNIGSQPFALLVLVVGFYMLVECKKWGIDTTIAGGVIGVASNMLQSQIKDAASVPGAKVHTETKVDSTTPPAEPDVQTSIYAQKAEPSTQPSSVSQTAGVTLNGGSLPQGRAYQNLKQQGDTI